MMPLMMGPSVEEKGKKKEKKEKVKVVMYYYLLTTNLRVPKGGLWFVCKRWE
jgi:hypothetical protein